MIRSTCSFLSICAAAVEFPDGFLHWLEYGQYEGRTAVGFAAADDGSDSTLVDGGGFDAKVNGTDFALLEANFNKLADGSSDGDFTYDGNPNGSN